MGEAYFYHLTQAPLEVTLRVLLGKSLQAGWRVAVRGRTEAVLDRLDEQLWLVPEDGFLPHGRAGGPHDADQPVLLTMGAAGNDPSCLVSVEGASVEAAEVGMMERVMVLFDGHDEAALQTAREQWKALTAAGVAAKYWSEASGRWEMKAESAAS
ncbi:DNA polymerase III subunit chi [Rhodobacteraceae bacterium N5(2021)]|uniref:DNA polymerase III subunit chi n=1 Tax=Gymnodinialimonas phycosphaerae TaxID=2841589 RepID=A0A975TWC8_9RHOB|nr:DNA polymerase III subunit chi [Gymnodinialimonas phycosphaerae]MBY4891612.1 DNA polymerase III subunit chi [Gymnodinialimonas phycosphaerae]